MESLINSNHSSQYIINQAAAFAGHNGVIDPCAIAPFCWEPIDSCSYQLAYSQEHYEGHESVSDNIWNSWCERQSGLKYTPLIHTVYYGDCTTVGT